MIKFKFVNQVLKFKFAQITFNATAFYTIAQTNTLLNAKENTITAGTTLQYLRGDKTFQTLDTLIVPENTNLYFTNERAQDAIGTILTNSNTVNFTYNDASNTITADARTQMSITSDTNGLKLVNDTLSVTASKYYGTDASSVKGFYALPVNTGEANTASNVGTAGVGVFKQKTGVNLEFKKVNAGSAKVVIIDDTANSEIDIDVNLIKADVGLSNVDNVSDLNKPISTLTQTALNTRLIKSGDTITGDISNTATGFFQIASGTTAQRPVTPIDGMRRYNTTLLRDEFYANGSWQNHARLSGDTFTGSITATNLSGTNTGDNATNTQYSGLAASKEDISNKSTVTTLGTSNTLYPTQNAVKVYTDTAVSTKQNSITLTTTGTSGASTLIGSTLNIPSYAGGGGGGTVTNVTSSTTDITVATGTTTPVITLVSAPKLTTARTINGVSFDGTANITVVDSTKENTITAGTTAQYYRGDKSFQTLDKTAVGLSNVDNTSDVSKPISTAQQTALNLKANLISPIFTTPDIGSATANSITLSGNISQAAWTTTGLRVRGVTAILTDTTSTGTVVAAYTDAFGGNTIASTTATTYTDYITAFFREPVAGTNVTMTRKTALGAESLRIGNSNQLTVSTTGVLTATSPIFTGSVTVPTPVAATDAGNRNYIDTAVATKKTDSMTTNKLLGRGTAGTGVIEEITLGTNLSLTGTTLNATGGGGGSSSLTKFEIYKKREQFKELIRTFTPEDEYQAMAIEHVLRFRAWAGPNQRLTINEYGFPSNVTANTPEAQKWARLLDVTLKAFNFADISSALWATGHLWGTYNLQPYTKFSTVWGTTYLSDVLETHLKDEVEHVGVNYAYFEFGSTLLAAPVDSDIAFIASRGIKMVRFPIKMEYLWAWNGTTIVAAALTNMMTAINLFHKYGIAVMIDIHNYAKYSVDNITIYNQNANEAIFQSFYNVLFNSDVSDNDGNTLKLKRHPAIQYIDIMNEPNQGSMTAAQWESISQNLCTYLRGTVGVPNAITLCVPLVGYSATRDVFTNHAKPWISDSNYMYVGHSYANPIGAAGSFDGTYTNAALVHQSYDTQRLDTQTQTFIGKGVVTRGTVLSKIISLGTQTFEASGSSLTQNITIPTGTNTVIVHVGARNAAGLVTGITINGVAMTQVAVNYSSGVAGIIIFRLTTALSGVQSMIVTLSAFKDFTVIPTYWSGVGAVNSLTVAGAFEIKLGIAGVTTTNGSTYIVATNVTGDRTYTSNNAKILAQYINTNANEGATGIFYQGERLKGSQTIGIEWGVSDNLNYIAYELQPLETYNEGNFEQLNNKVNDLPDIAVSAVGTLVANINSRIGVAGTYTAPSPATILTAPPQRFAITNTTTANIILNVPNASGTVIAATLLPTEVITFRQTSTLGYSNESGNKSLLQLDARYIQLGGDIGGTTTVPFILGATATTTNFVPNPSFETNFGFWSTYGTFGTVVRDSATAQFGTWSSLQTNAAVQDGGITSSAISLSVGSYTFSVWAKLSTGVVNAHMVLRVVGGSSVAQINQTYPGNTNWNQYTQNFTITTAANYEILLGLGSFGAQSNGTASFDAIAIQSGSSQVTYFDGSLTSTAEATYTWTGTAHASNSTRVARARLQTTDNLPEGTSNLYLTSAKQQDITSQAYITSLYFS